MTDRSELPASKAELLERMREGRAAWDSRIAQAPESAMLEPLLPDGWSLKDLIAHVAAYETWTAAQLRASNEGRAPTDMELYGVEALPPDPQGWDLDRQNAAIYARYQATPLADVRAFSRRAFADLLAAVEGMSEEDLAKPGTPSWPLESSLLSVIPMQSYAHYDQHIDDLRAITGQDLV